MRVQYFKMCVILSWQNRTIVMFQSQKNIKKSQKQTLWRTVKESINI